LTVYRPIGAPALTPDQCISKWRFCGEFRINRNDTLGASKLTFNPWTPRTMSGVSVSDPNNINPYSYCHFQDMAMLCAEYFNAVPIYRFWGIYPDMMQGRYYFEMNPARDNFANNYRRQPIIEWDLSKSDYIDITIPSYSQAGVRPTRSQSSGYFTGPGESTLPLSYYDSGTISLFCQNPVQILSIFPDAYYITIWQTFIDLQQYVACPPYRLRHGTPMSGINLIPTTNSDYVLEMTNV